MSGSLTTTATFQPSSGINWTINDISITPPVVTETDIGSVQSFLGSSTPFGFSASYFSLFHEATLQWGGGHAGVSTSGSSLTVNFNYNLSVPSGADAITSLGELVVVDQSSGTFSLSATETVTNSSGAVVATLDWTPSSTSPSFTLPTGYQNLTVSVTLKASIAAGQTGSVAFSSVSQTFFESPVTATPAITVDKQISIDGVTWFDVGQGVLNGPTVIAGDKVYERAIVTDTGNTALSNVTVADVNGLPSGFTFAGSGATSLAAGQSITSDIGTVVASLGANYDTATATGTVTGGTTTVTSTDQANYTGVTPSITIDKQISINGTTWQDVGSGVLNNPTVLAGGTVYERVIVTDTGALAINNATVSDISTTGGVFPSGFSFGGASTINLAAGQAITSDVATLTASIGHQIDTATVTGTATDTVNTVTLTASDNADYTGVSISGNSTPITIDKQVSTNGITWQDVGQGVLNGPTVLTGGTVYERVLVTDTGALAVNNASVTDVNGPPGFTFGGAGTVAAIAAGQTIISDIATVVAQAGQQIDTATVTGTVTDGTNTGTVTAQDSANYVGVTPSITVDKQISVNGGVTWQDVGTGNLAQDPTVLAGSSVQERVIVTDTGSIALSGVAVTDAGGNGPAG
ncbi:MAG: hypothetical protein KGL52_06690, partial [Rhodospirillales bacterium]|nr:hypothetical protein [Rhodospirillales bacterium]